MSHDQSEIMAADRYFVLLWLNWCVDLLIIRSLGSANFINRNILAGVVVSFNSWRTSAASGVKQMNAERGAIDKRQKLLSLKAKR